MEQAGDVPMEVDASEPAAAEAEAPAVDPAIEAKFARARECRAEGAALWKAGEVGKASASCGQRASVRSRARPHNNTPPTLPAPQAMFSWHEVLLNLSGLDRNGQLSGVGAAPASAAPSLTPAQLAEQRDLQLAAHNNLAAGLLKARAKGCKRASPSAEKADTASVFSTLLCSPCPSAASSSARWSAARRC